MEWILEAVLAALLAATLFHAVRLERALGVLKRDRAALEALVASFNDSSRQAEAGIEQLHAAADGAGRQMARQIDTTTRLKDDLIFLLERGERLADRLESLIRAGRSLAAEPMHHPLAGADDQAPEMPRVRSQAERDLLKALRMAR
ncbi:MAG TPA: DUF6468 domain-containing protein [Acetobacteraceae bacterium]|jgi:chromosome segregation ATPase|nr:DUF6468 domain-containing protein [Acetobacteraceae bacterium]